MRKKLLTALLIISASMVFFSFVIEEESTNSYPAIILSNPPAPGKNFINMIFSAGANDPVMFFPNFMTQIKQELYFDYVHGYGVKGNPTIYSTFGELLSGSQLSTSNSLYSSVGTAGLKLLGNRTNIEYMCYAQRMIYEVPAYTNDTLTNYGFCYRNYRGVLETDNGRTVLHACADGTCPNSDANSPGYILENVYENLQFGDLFDFTQADAGTWYIKPVMKIPTGLDPNTDIVKIVVVNYEGNTILQVPIKAENFSSSGVYVQDYVLLPEPLEVSGNNTPSGTGLNAGVSADIWEDWRMNCNIDFKVWWYGEADVWIDRMIVDDELGNDLFTLGLYDDVIKEEAEEFGSNANNYAFYTDELPYSNYSAARYVDSLIKSTNSGANFHYAISNYHHARGYKNNLTAHRPLLENIHPVSFNVDAHELFGTQIPYHLNNVNSQIPDIWKSSSDHYYNLQIQKKSFGDKNAIVTDEKDWSTPTNPKPPPWGSLIYQINLAREQRDLYSPGAKLVMQPQIHGFATFNSAINKYTSWGREPTNEEIEAQAMICIAHGADGISWFWHPSISWGSSSIPDFGYRGLSEYLELDMDAPSSNKRLVSLGLTKIYGMDIDPQEKRTSNLYGQNKFDYVADMNDKIMNSWKTTLDRVDWISGWSVHSEGANHEYVSDLISIAPYISGLNACEEDGPYAYTDCEEERYWEMGFFNAATAGDNSKYFMMVNRRCVPEYVESSVQKGDARVLKIKFDQSDLSGYRNWKLEEVGGSQTIIFDVLNQGSNGFLALGDTENDLGWFKPGEGKLFRLAPVIFDGGMLVSDEVISEDAMISDTVWTDGFNLTIEDGSTITFDTNGVIVAQGGNFTCGDLSGSHGGVDLIGTGEWNGIKLNGCDTVNIYNTSIEDIKDSSYALDMFNCKNVEMEGNTFTLDNSGAVRGSYIFSFEFFTPNIVLYDNTVNIGANTIPVFNFNANSASSFPVIIDDCDMNAPSSSSSSAISMTNISGGVIKNNDITGYNTSVLALSSAMDFYNNAITSSTNDCIISGSSGSTLGLKETGGKGTGGENFFSTSHEDANNVEIYGGYFFAEDGYNTFDIAASYDDGKHFSGYFAPEGEFSPSLEYNCFTEDGSPVSPVYDITWDIAGDPVTFAYTYDCTAGEGAGLSSKTENNYLIVPITDRYNDTIKIRDGNFTLTASDSMSVEMRKRNYAVTIGIAERILENSSGSPVAYDALSKLYLASLRLDSAGSKMIPLKTFLEEVILDNGDKPGLVSRAFYFIQKCKAALGQYQSALTGFGDIITNNPNTYDALVSSWDYAATTLLMNGGQGGGEKPAFGEEELFAFHSFIDDPKDPIDDRSKLTKEQKQQVKVNVVKSFEETRKEEINVINKLKEKSDRGDRNAQKELKRRETLQAVVTKRQPEDIYEHINNVSSDIRVVFNSTDDNLIKKEQNSVPVEFELSQNFPNPFNPTTKIQYALPKDGKVQLVIYDILGREMAKLVNNEFKSAGRYVSEFNGSRLASGIYFYRILVNDGKDFTQVKKMVLVK
jgi:hypothetical protein